MAAPLRVGVMKMNKTLMTNDNKVSLGAHNVSDEGQQRLEAEYQYGSWENYSAKVALLDAEEDLRRRYCEVAQDVTDEEVYAPEQ